MDPPTEVPIEATQAPTQATEAPQKKARTQAQIDALAAARIKALQVRKERAQARHAPPPSAPPTPVPEEEEDPWEADIPEEEPPYAIPPPPKPKKRKKPARRVIVTEVSSDEGTSDSDVEVILPKARAQQPAGPSPLELEYQNKMNKMFRYGI